MFEHRRSFEQESIAKRLDKQRRSVVNALAGYQSRLNRSGEVRLKRFANNELRVSWQAEARLPRRAGSKAGAERCFEEAERLLVYNGKVQRRGDFIQSAPVRSRPMKLTRYAAHRVREACAVIEEKYGTESYFVTLTLPGSTVDALETAAREATGILNAYMQRIRQSFQTAHQELMACGVWEYQKRGALHFHLLIGCENVTLAKELKRHHQRWWRQVLLHYSQKVGVDLFARSEGGTWRDCPNKPRTQCAKVKKSVSRYMSKYLAKSAREIVSDGWKPPASWHYLSSGVWESVKQERRLDCEKFDNFEVAASAADVLAEVAQNFGGKVLPMENPFTSQTCGYVIYFDNGKKDECHHEMLQVFDEWRGVVCQGVRGSPYMRCECGECDQPETDAELIFQGRPLYVVSEGCADLCAPFSAPEKGGGMR